MKEGLCAKCGACTSVCPVYQVTGKETLTARGRIHLLEKLTAENHSRDYRQIFSKCLLCNACRSSCPRQIDLPAMVIEARQDFPRLSGNGSFKGTLLKQCLEHQTILAGLGSLGKFSIPLHRLLPTNSGLRLKLGLIDENIPEAKTPSGPAEPYSSSDTPQVAIFSGCLARHLKPEITSGMVSLLSSFGIEHVTIPQDQMCCGMASHNSGDIEAARKLALKNISAFGDNDLPVIVPCASCLAQLKDYPAILGDEWRHIAEKFTARVTDLSSFLASENHIPLPHSPTETSPAKRVVYHTPCHLRYQGSAAAATRQLLNSRADIELIELDSDPHCCGFGGLFNLAHPKLSDRIATGLIDEIIAADPDIVVTDCSGCLIQLHMQLSARGSHIKAQHLVPLLIKSE